MSWFVSKMTSMNFHEKAAAGWKNKSERRF